MPNGDWLGDFGSPPINFPKISPGISPHEEPLIKEESIRSNSENYNVPDGLANCRVGLVTEQNVFGPNRFIAFASAPPSSLDSQIIAVVAVW